MSEPILDDLVLMHRVGTAAMIEIDRRRERFRESGSSASMSPDLEYMEAAAGKAAASVLIDADKLLAGKLAAALAYFMDPAISPREAARRLKVARQKKAAG